MHECPACGQACYCDMEDHGQTAPEDCVHECDDDHEEGMGWEGDESE